MKKKRKLRADRVLILIVAAALIIGIPVKVFASLAGRRKEAAPHKTAETVETIPVESAEPVVETYQAKLFMAGDALIHGAVYYCAQQPDGTYDFHEIMKNMKTLAEDYDLRYYNQETILGGTEMGLSSYPRFNTPQEFGDTMVDYGFNLVSTANNHSLDMDEAGILRSTAYWKNKESQGVHMTGTFDSPEAQQALPVYEVNGITYTFLAYTYGCNGLEPPAGKEYLVNLYPGHEAEMLDKVRQADEVSDVVIICMHWGTEYSMDVNEEQLSLAQQLSDAGADIIIGCHPHVIEPIQWLNDGKTIVYYSLGNMVSAQDQLPRIIGMIGGITITKTVTDGVSEISLSDARADLIYTKYDIIGGHFYNFRVYPFSDLTEELLPDHEAIYNEFSSKITELDPTILVGGF